MGSCLVTGLEALIDKWGSRDELTGVRILEAHKASDAEDVTTEDGLHEAIWFGDVAISYDVPTMRAGVVEYEETCDVPVVIQVVRPGEDDSDQLGVWERAEEIFDGCVATIQEDATLGVTAFRRFECTIESADVTHGRFQGDGHGARYELQLVFVSRNDAPS